MRYCAQLCSTFRIATRRSRLLANASSINFLRRSSAKKLCHAMSEAADSLRSSVAWIVGLGAMAVRFPATANYRADGTWAKISQLHKLLQDVGALGFQGG